MLLKKRIERSMGTMRERNRRYLESQGQYTGPDANAFEEKEEAGEVGLKDYMQGKPVADNRSWEALDELEKEKEAIEAYRKNNEELDFEKGDVFAIILAAFITFAPVILGILALMGLAWWILS